MSGFGRDPAVLAALEPGQRSEATAAKLPRRVLGRGVLFLLVLLRVYVFVAVPLVVYAFIQALRTTGQ